MKRSYPWLLVLSFALLAAASGNPLFAYCGGSAYNFPIFQCADAAYFEPVPAPYTTADVVPVFWQIGFGNDTVNLGSPAEDDGTGVSGKSTFNGNDQGTFPIDLTDAHAFAPTYFPPGSTCLLSNNWANYRVDGCPDNPRVPYFYSSGYLYDGDDDLLNPFFSTYLDAHGYPGVYSLVSQMDYPMAILLKLPGDTWFAVAAVAASNRGNDGSGDNGPCAATPGTNPGPCNTFSGSYSFGDVTDGHPNQNDSSKLNAIPWQPTPHPSVDASSPVDPNDPGAGFAVDLSWSAAVVYTDQSVRPSTNPSLAPADPNSAPGVGVLDVATMGGLVHYLLDVAPSSDPGFGAPSDTVECPGDPGCTSDSSASLVVPDDSCVRIRTAFGLRPRTAQISRPNCRLGRCGDVGYEVTSPRICFSASCQPSDEICDGLDNNCDGQTDEGFGTGGACVAPGQCGPGTIECSSPSTTICSTAPGGSMDGSSPEICDGLDNDCDGLTDEGFGIGDACQPPGQCGPGTIECSSPSTTICSTAPGGSMDGSSPEICDGLDNDCDGQTDEGLATIQATAAISPTNLNVNSQGNNFSVALTLYRDCGGTGPGPVDGSLVGDVHVSRAGSVLIPDPLTLPCPDAGGSYLFERGIVDDVPARITGSGGVTLKFDLPTDGDCRTLDGNRQDLLSLLSDSLDGAPAPVCVAGTADGIPFEACDSPVILNKGNR